MNQPLKTFEIPEAPNPPRLSIKEDLENYGDDLRVNPEFQRWYGLIKYNLSNKKLFQNDTKYKHSSRRALLERCRDHVQENRRTTYSTERTIVLVHPFYLHYTNMHQVGPSHEEAVEIYTGNIQRLLDTKRDLQKVGVVVFDSLFHYTALTSRLLELELIDDVFFTEQDGGQLLDHVQVSPLLDSEIYFAGSYNEECLWMAIWNVKKLNPNLDAWGIKDLVLGSGDNFGMIAKTVSNLDPSRSITLDCALQKLGLE